MTGKDRYSGIPLGLLRQYKGVLLRRTERTWTATMAGLPGFEATGSTRAEALQQAHAMLRSHGA
jgi:predicted RNase H-like HicB family nuclease